MGATPDNAASPDSIASPDNTAGTVADGTLLERARRWVKPGIALPILAYVLLSLFGITTSSLGASYNRQNIAVEQNFMIGEPQTVRSDEYLRGTPMQLGVIAAGDTLTTPLAQDPDLVTQIPDSGIAETIVFFDTAALRLGPWFPDEMVYAAVRWFPLLMFVLFCPLWFQKLGASKRASWFGTGLIFVSPACAWWSFLPLVILGFVTAGCYFLIVSAERWASGRRLLAAGYAIAAGIFLTRLVTGYIPWSLTIGVPMVVATAIWLVWAKEHRVAGVAALATGTVASMAALAILIVENSSALAAQVGTVYPGQRRTTGRPLDPGDLFNAPILFKLQYDTPLVQTNSSEISNGYTIALVLAIVLVCLIGGFSRRRDDAALVTLLVLCLGWFSWITIKWGIVGERIPILNLVDPARVAQTLGIPAVMALTLTLSRWRRPTRRWVPLVLAAVMGFITAYGAGFTSLVKMPELRLIDVGIGAVGVGLVVYFLTAFPDRRWPYVTSVLLAAAAVFAVNPITFGLGDLRNSASAERMLEAGKQARASGELWATDLWFDDAMLNATGTPILGGNQMSGPATDQWLKLDPSRKYEGIWNRGASYIVFDWSVDEEIIVTSPANDSIRVTVDPCRLQDLGFNVTHIISTAPLENSCLIAEPGIEWDSQQQYVYQVTT